MNLITKFKLFNEEVRTDKYRCSVCGGPLYRTDAGGKYVTLQCISKEANFSLYPRGTKEQNDAHSHFMKSIINITPQEWEEAEQYNVRLNESKKIKKKTKIKKVSDALYNWVPTTNSVSPAPIPNTTISQIKI